MIRRFRNKIGDWLRTIHFEDRVMLFAKSRNLWGRWESPPDLIDVPDGDRILILAPHMDDEVIGCGGTIRKCVLAGKDVAVVYMTDGRFGDDRLAEVTGQERWELQQALIQTRKEEARRACEILGIGSMTFIDAEDAHLQSTPETHGKLLAVLAAVRPDTVFCPFFTEDHKDHRETTRILLDATVDSVYAFECYCYEVWTPIFPNCLVDITDTMACKREALQAHASQLRGIDYLRAMEALSTYRAMRISRNGYGEAFWRVSLEQLRYFHDKLSANSQAGLP